MELAKCKLCGGVAKKHSYENLDCNFNCSNEECVMSNVYGLSASKWNDLNADKSTVVKAQKEIEMLKKFIGKIHSELCTENLIRCNLDCIDCHWTDTGAWLRKIEHVSKNGFNEE